MLALPLHSPVVTRIVPMPAMRDPTQPEFSVVIPTHARPDRLRACVAGIAALDLDGASVEVIVVNDGGAALDPESLADVHPGLSLRVINQPQQGPAAARNAGAAVARGRYLAFIDDDCVPDSGWLRAFARVQAEDDRRLLGGRVENALVHNAYSDASERITSFVYERSRAGGAAELFFTTNNIALRADLFRTLGGFTTAIPSQTAEDKDFCARWRAHGLALAHAPDAVVRHAHELTLRRFLRQHFNYGRGLLAFRLLRPHHGRIVPERPGFYLELVTSPLRDATHRGRVRATILLGLAQLATLAGAAHQALRWPVDRPRHRHPPDPPRGPAPSGAG